MKLKAFGSLAALLLAVSAPAFADKSAGDVVDDGTITTEVKAGLVGAKGVDSNDINIETYKGIVLLSGFVTDQAQKDSADKVTKAVKGVKKVENRILVHSSTSMGTKLDDTALVGKVKSALVDADKVKFRPDQRRSPRRHRATRWFRDFRRHEEARDRRHERRQGRAEGRGRTDRQAAIIVAHRVDERPRVTGPLHVRRARVWPWDSTSACGPQTMNHRNCAARRAAGTQR